MLATALKYCGEKTTAHRKENCQAKTFTVLVRQYRQSKNNHFATLSPPKKFLNPVTNQHGHTATYRCISF